MDAYGGSGSALSLPASAARDVRAAVDGIRDALKLRPLFERIRDEPRTQAALIKGGVVQLVALVSVLIFDHLFIPGLASRGVEHGRQQAVAAYYQLLWLYPCLGLSFLLGGYAQRSAQSGSSSQHTDLGTTARVVSELYRGLVLVQCFAASFILYRIPLIGRLLSLLYLSLTNSLYCFESLWMARGWSLAAYLESHWAWFIGFGLPCTALSSLSSSALTNLALFSIAWPFATLLASAANPPSAAAGPMGDTLLPSDGPGASAPTPSHPHWPRRLPALWLAVRINTALEQALTPVLRRQAQRGGKKATDWSGPVPVPSYAGPNAHHGGFAAVAQQPSPRVGPGFGVRGHAQQAFQQPPSAPHVPPSVVRPGYAQSAFKPIGTAGAARRRPAGDKAD